MYLSIEKPKMSAFIISHFAYSHSELCKNGTELHCCCVRMFFLLSGQLYKKAMYLMELFIIEKS